MQTLSWFQRRAPLAAAAVLLLSLPALAPAQELRVQPTPFSVWVDFQKLPSRTTAALPIWMESLQRSLIPATPETRQKTNFRIRLRRLGNLSSDIQLRLFFDDQPGFSPRISGWSETGLELYHSPALGAGLGLHSSENVTIPVANMDYLDIDVPGDGKTIRGAFITSMRKYEAQRALDFEPASTVDDAFANAPTPPPAKNDLYLYGRVKANLEAESLLITPVKPQRMVEFELESPPLMAVISFQALQIDPMHPPELKVNDYPLTRLSVQLPDLADPGYTGTVRPLEADMQFHYSGWVRCQQIVPGSKLLGGLNKLVFSMSNQSGSLAIRSVEIELKYFSQNLDYELTH